MLTLLTGAKKNIGDFLITERTRQLLEKFAEEREFLVIERWRPFDDRLNEINSTRGIVICGGPAYDRNFYPQLMPLVNDLSKIRVPIVPLGLGLQGLRPDKLGSFEFTKESLSAIKFIHETCALSGTRDAMALDVLRKNGITNAALTGCPVMYDLPSFGKPFSKNTAIKRIVFTPPAGKRLHGQALRLAKRLRRKFPKAEILACFHRGLSADEHTKFGDALRCRLLAATLRLYGIRSLDVSYDLKKIEFYRDCDLHVGYRVHAHVMFNSMRKPSFLIQEDSRGMGLSKTLGLDSMDIPAKDALADKIIVERIDRELEVGFNGFSRVPEVIESHFKNMERVIRQLKSRF